MRFLVNKIFVALFLALLNYPLFSQSLLPEQISMQNGLSSNNVNTIFIDDQDRTWIATDTDLYQYVSGNLYEFKAKNRVDILKCTDIKQDKNGNLWFASYGNGIYKYNDGIITSYGTQQGLVDNKVNKIYIKDNFIYVGTDNGVSIFNITTNSFVSPKINQFKKYANFSINDFIEINDEIYFITLNDGFFKIVNINRIEPRVIKIRNHNYVTSLFLWKDKIYEGRINKIKVYSTIDYLQNGQSDIEIPISNVKKFTVRGERLVAISGALYDNDGGLYIIRPDHTYREFTITDDNISKSFTSIAINNNTQKSFVGTQNNGFLIFDVDPNKSFFQSTNSIVNSIKQYKDKVIFIYNDKIEIKTRKDQLIHQVSNKDICLFFQPETQYQRIQFLNLEIFNNTFYLRTNVGTFALTEDLSTYQQVSESEAPIVFHKGQLYSFDKHYKDSDTNSFIGSLYDDNPNQLPHLLFDAIEFGNKIVVSTKNKGLYLIENGNVTSLVHNKAFIQSNINFIQKSKNNKLLVVTDFVGIYELDPEQNFKVVSHIAPCTISGKNIFFVDSYGLHYVVGTELGIEFINTDKYYILNSDYGLPHSNYSTGKVIDNTLYVGGLGGYYKFNIQKFLTYNNSVKSIAINSIYSINKRNTYSWDGKEKNRIVVKPNQAPLVINFIPYTKEDAKGQKVRYKINPESSWSNYSKEMSVQLLDLSENSYQIELEFFDESNQTRQQIHLIDVEVQHSIWPKILYTILILFALCILIFIYQLFKIGKNKIEELAELDFSIIDSKGYNLGLNEIVKDSNIEDTYSVSLEMKMLLNSLNAHFIFNAVNYLQYAILQKEAKEALRYNECVAKFFRELIKNGATTTVSIANEMSYIMSYVDVERTRFEYEIDFNIKVDENLDINNIYIPTFILHPILETMLNYSFYDNIEKACILIEIEDVCEEAIQITYSYNGQSIKEIENNKVNRFNSSLLLLIDCLKWYNKDPNSRYFCHTNAEMCNKVTFKLNV